MRTLPLPTSRPTLRRLVLALGGLAVVASGCAARQKAGEVAWPLPPDKPRVKYVRSISVERDLDPSIWRRAGRSLVTTEESDAILQPTGIALSADEQRLYVACVSRNRVIEVDLTNRTMHRVAEPEGYRPKTPFAVAIDADDTLYVSDSSEGLVWTYDRDGKFVRQIGKRILERPTGIAVDRRRQLLYVVDGARKGSQNHKVEVFSLAGDHVRTIGKRGSGPGELNFPDYVAVAPDGNVYVSDMLNFRVQVFDPEGTLVTMFGSVGQGPGEFDKLKGIAFDGFGNVHAVDGQTGIVQIFNSRHQVLMAYGGRANRIEFTILPTAIAIDSRNNIYVADWGGSRVNQYVLFDTTAEDSVEGAPNTHIGGSAPPTAAPIPQQPTVNPP